MTIIRRVLSLLFLVLAIFVFLQCARRGTPSGGPKDITPPVLIKTEPLNLSTDFKDKKIRLYFDEYVRLEDVQNQLIVSPPLKYNPQISPQGVASKVIEIQIKDTLEENTTYTINFGQSIVDNNEGNPNRFLTYVFSTGSYIDSLSVSGVVKDAFNREADDFVSILLYEIDTTYTDSTVYKRPPNYITNTLDSTNIFTLRYLKEGRYAMIAIKDNGKNNIFDQTEDKIGFIQDTVVLPADTVYLLNLFKEIPNYSVPPPTYAAANKIIFGYYGEEEKLTITPLSSIPDSIETLVAKVPEKDTLNFWFTPFEVDSLIFEVYNEQENVRDTFTVKTRKLLSDSLMLYPSHRRELNFQDDFSITSSIPIKAVDSSKIVFFNKDSVNIPYSISLDSLMNKIDFDFAKEPNETYSLELYPNIVKDIFGNTNDTIAYRLSTGGLADFGNLRLNLEGDVSYPMLIQLTDKDGKLYREVYLTEGNLVEFNTIKPDQYYVRVIFDNNANKKWDTGSYLLKKQPERVAYYPLQIEVRANWELEQTFSINKN
ncbi:Ig-like domain-containing protein [Eudoraea chungangensis]|uniref:Ig-like domain-containing protein n=1 Tax=Eudoraea chungangensis TaxID=1481905 RepID=UPI0023EA7E91|nr:Ig-like domain-containing protein [Eudoraea chungangensis]